MSHAALLGAAAQDGQGVRAGVDDHHPVTELGDPDREPAGAASDVDHGGRAFPRSSSSSRRAFHTTVVRAALRRWELLWPGFARGLTRSLLG